jgi:hypothetical protein
MQQKVLYFILEIMSTFITQIVSPFYYSKKKMSTFKRKFKLVLFVIETNVVKNLLSIQEGECEGQKEEGSRGPRSVTGRNECARRWVTL